MAGHPRIRGEHYLLVQPAPEAADHPRIRGEHPPLGAAATMTSGSSPHTRGAREGSLAQLAVARIIPAYAGSTGLRLHDVRLVQDHPRIRGEHRLTNWPLKPSDSSSPHTRGAPSEGARGPERGLIIPAYAGSTSSNTGLCPQVRDHPRIRGEYRERGTGGSRWGADHPRIRGEHGLPAMIEG